MSGFVALLNLDGSPVDRRLLGRMTAFLAFRGPDGHQWRAWKNAGLGHAFLKVTDEGDCGRQPVTLDGRSWIAADARVDARADLIRALSGGDANGSCDAEASDAALILHAYRRWGEDCVAHLLGDFSFAIWDETRQRLFGARDHLGVKPFFYARLDATVVVSNTLDCIRLHPQASNALDDAAVADFLLFGENQETGTTVFRDIRRLPPAHALTWSRDASRLRSYWTLPVDEPIQFRRADDYTDRFRELLLTATHDRLRTRRVSVLMSGGLDSPTLAAAAQQVLRERPVAHALQAITSVYDRLIEDPERHYAGLVAAHLGIPIRYDPRDDEPSIVEWARVSVSTPEPVANPPAFVAAVDFLRKHTAHGRVFLYGEGPDNALRYEWRPYVSHLLSQRRLGPILRALSGDILMHPRVPLWSSIRQRAAAGRQERRWRGEFPSWLNQGFAARAGCRERWQAHRRPSPSSLHPVRPLGYGGFIGAAWQPLFDDCDITAAHGHAEFRHPFLDIRLLRYMLALPAMPWCRNKLIIRRSMRSALPGEVLRRKKTIVPNNPDFTRAIAAGLPRATGSQLSEYVDPHRIPRVPDSELDLRSALRPLGLDYWLQRFVHTTQGEIRDETIAARF